MALFAVFLLVSSVWTTRQVDAQAIQRLSSQPSPSRHGVSPGKVLSGIVRHSKAVERNECFPVESLSPELQVLSKQLLLEALDSEALYTIVGDLKPISEGFFDTFFQTAPPEVDELERVRQAIRAWQCGEHYDTGVLAFNHLREGERYASAWIASKPALARKLDEQSDFFGQLGMRLDSSAESLLLRADGARIPAERWRGFGFVFGYPKAAVDFFVRAGEHQAATGEFVERDFRQYPTHARSTGGFVYAVPRLEQPSLKERQLSRQVESILTLYRAHRDRHIPGDDPHHVVELLRNWFDDGTGWCHPDHAMQRARAWDEARRWVEDRGIRLATVAPSAENLDLESLDKWLSEPRIIAMGESTHGTREFFQLKHRLFRHLVKKHGVRLFGIEASFAACLPIDDYIQTGRGDPRAAIKSQGFWTWDTEEVLALVEWMREWNENRPPSESPVKFYGFDTQDAYTPLKLVLAKLRKTDADAATTFHDRLSLALQEQYGDSLGSATRDQLDELLNSIQELKTFCADLRNRSDEQRRKTELLLQQAAAAIRIDRSQLDRWSSIGMLKEVDLYSRIRTKIGVVDAWASKLDGEQSAALQSFVAAAADLKRCRLRFRDDMDEAECQEWRDAVQWASSLADSDEVREAMMDMRQFLEVATEYRSKPRELVNVRDETMAKFVAQVLKQHGEGARIMLWAHDWHISKLDGNPIEDVPRMGTYLERRFGEDYLPVGLSFGSGCFQAKYYPQEEEDPARLVLREFEVDGSRYDSFSQIFDYCDAPVAAFDISLASQALPQWFAAEHHNRTIGAVFQPELADSDSYYEEMVLGDHFELVMHVRETERARPLRPQARFRFGAKWVEDVQASKGDVAEVDTEKLGAVVKSVSPGSMAESTGLKAGDRVVQLGEIQIKTASDIETALADIQQPGSLELKLFRQQGNDEDHKLRELTFFIVVPPWIAE